MIQGIGFFANYNRVIGFTFWRAEVYASTQRPAAITRLLLEHQTVIPLVNTDRAYISRKNVNDTTNLKWQAWVWWTPADAWLSK